MADKPNPRAERLAAALRENLKRRKAKDRMAGEKAQVDGPSTAQKREPKPQ